MNIDPLSMTNAVILQEIGNRIERLRLNKNLRQSDVCEVTGLSIDTIRALEKGKAKLDTVIAVLRTLEALDQLDSFIPPQEIDPIALAKMQGKMRQRARRN